MSSDVAEAASICLNSAIASQQASKYAAAAASRVFDHIERTSGADAAFDVDLMSRMMEDCKQVEIDCDKAKNYIKRVLESLTEIEMKMKMKSSEQDIETDEIKQDSKRQRHIPRPTSIFDSDFCVPRCADPPHNIYSI